MEIKYTFVNGEETSIEVYGNFEGIILELDRDLKNNNRKSTLFSVEDLKVMVWRYFIGYWNNRRLRE